MIRLLLITFACFLQLTVGNIDPNLYLTAACRTVGNDTVPRFDCYKNGSLCIDLSKHLDGVNDCANAADEECWGVQVKCDGSRKCVNPAVIATVCHDYLPNGCPGDYRCPLTTICLKASALLNGSAECPDKSDEDPTIQSPCLNGKTVCPLYSTCSWTRVAGVSCICNTGFYNKSGVCAPDPGTRYGASPCTRTPILQFRCGDGKCINYTSVRDCKVDCNDGADEACAPNQIACDKCKCVQPTDYNAYCVDRTSTTLPTTTVSPTSATNATTKVTPIPTTTTTTVPSTTTKEAITTGQLPPVSLAFVLDTTGSMVGIPAFVQTGLIASGLLQRLYKVNRINQYVVVSFNNNQTSKVITNITTGSGSPAEETAAQTAFSTAVNSWTTGDGNSCPEPSIAAVSLAVQTVQPMSIIYVFTDADARDTPLLNATINLANSKQIQINFIMSGDCGNLKNPGYVALQQIASATGGLFIPVVNSQNKLDQYKKIFTQISIYVPPVRVLLEAIDSVDGDVTLPIPMDAGLADALLTVVGCNTTTRIRDATGVWNYPANNPQHYYMASDTSTFTAVWMEVGHGDYVFQINSHCPVMVRITAMGSPDFNYKWLPRPDITASSKDIPNLGVESYVWVNPQYQLLQPSIVPTVPPNQYEVQKVEIVDVVGRSHYTSLLGYQGVSVGGYDINMLTRLPMRPHFTTFYIKVTGYDTSYGKFQRYSFTPMRPVEPNLNGLFFAPNCSTGFSCSVGGTCLGLGKYKDCRVDCLDTGADEACSPGFQKCDCNCVAQENFDRNCRKTDLYKFCQLMGNSAYKDAVWTCANGLECIPLLKFNDGLTDCSDNSDEDPSQIDECSTEAVCSNDATCTNVVNGSYYCQCNSGFQGDGYSCAEAITTPMVITTTTTALSPTPATEPVLNAIFSAACNSTGHSFNCGVNNGTQVCIPLSSYRDCTVDCFNGLDEQCFVNQANCGCGLCVNAVAARDMCVSYSVLTTVCGVKGSITCKNGTGCIMPSWILDGRVDCPDKSDEDFKLYDECAMGKQTCDLTKSSCVDSIVNPPSVNGQHLCACNYGFKPNVNSTTDATACVPVLI